MSSNVKLLSLENLSKTRIG